MRHIHRTLILAFTALIPTLLSSCRGKDSATPKTSAGAGDSATVNQGLAHTAIDRLL